MTRITRFRSSSYTGYGQLGADTVRELDTGREHPLDAVQLLAPCAPSKIVCVGRNYREHAKELGNEVPKEPLIFLKPPSSVIAGGETIRLPSLSKQVEHEAEIGVILGARLSNASESKAKESIAAIVAVNDV